MTQLAGRVGPDDSNRRASHERRYPIWTLCTLLSRQSAGASDRESDNRGEISVESDERPGLLSTLFQNSRLLHLRWLRSRPAVHFQHFGRVVELIQQYVVLTTCRRQTRDFPGYEPRFHPRRFSGHSETRSALLLPNFNKVRPNNAAKMQRNPGNAEIAQSKAHSLLAKLKVTNCRFGLFLGAFEGDSWAIMTLSPVASSR
ncbi:hypothetical protein ACVW17_003385 [Bradyrhizobium sp. USDA 4473]